jgi:hypothetical protein
MLSRRALAYLTRPDAELLTAWIALHRIASIGWQAILAVLRPSPARPPSGPARDFPNAGRFI